MEPPYMDKLIAELEQATEGSRKLDKSIYVVLGLPITNKDHLTPQMIEIHLETVAPHYSRSLDAALTLVPEGWGWDVMHDSIAAVRPPDSEGDDELAVWGLAPHGTPALALCIASLRARQVEVGVREVESESGEAA